MSIVRATYAPDSTLKTHRDQQQKQHRAMAARPHYVSIPTAPSLATSTSLERAEVCRPLITNSCLTSLADDTALEADMQHRIGCATTLTTNTRKWKSPLQFAEHTFRDMEEQAGQLCEPQRRSQGSGELSSAFGEGGSHR